MGHGSSRTRRRAGRAPHPTCICVDIGHHSPTKRRSLAWPGTLLTYTYMTQCMATLVPLYPYPGSDVDTPFGSYPGGPAPRNMSHALYRPGVSNTHYSVSRPIRHVDPVSTRRRVKAVQPSEWVQGCLGARPSRLGTWGHGMSLTSVRHRSLWHGNSACVKAPHCPGAWSQTRSAP